MPEPDELTARLRQALATGDGADLDALLAEAREEAWGRARATLADALTDALLDLAASRFAPVLEPSGPAPAPPPAVSHPEPEPGAAPSPHADGGDPAARLGWYLYGVAAGEDGTPLDALPGVDARHPVVTLWEAGLAVFASRVPLSDFDDEPLRAHLSDMGWVERMARRHQEILDALAGSRTVVPMRMCSIYRDEDGLRAMLHAEAEALGDTLATLRGQREWGVKGFARRPPQSTATAEPSAAAGGEEGPRAGAGASYLAGRVRERDQRRNAGQELAEAVELAHARLHALASDTRTLPLQRPEVSGHREEMVFNGVYLVPDSAAEAFQRTVAELEPELAARGLRLVITGPWPAYNFVPDAVGASR